MRDEMITSNEVVRIVLEELDKLQREKHWGEVVFRIPLKNGDPQQLNVGYERTFREPNRAPAKP